MGVRILEGREGEAVFYCSTTDWAFGPLMPSLDVAEAFLRTYTAVGDDPRNLTDAELEKHWNAFRGITEACPHGHWNKVDIDVSPKSVTFTCYEKGCNAVWDLDGDMIEEEEDDDLTEAERLGEARVMR